jgi:hypothetical protein
MATSIPIGSSSSRVVARRRGIATSRRTTRDLFLLTPDEFRVANERRIVEQGGRQKHVEVTSFDREILARVQAKRGISGAELLHPSQMYQLFDNFWLQRTPVTLIEAFSVFTPLPAPPPTGILAQAP